MKALWEDGCEIMSPPESSTNAASGIRMESPAAYSPGGYFLIGCPIPARTGVCKRLAARARKNLEPVVYIATDEDCETVRSTLQDLVRGETGASGDLGLIDMCSRTTRNG